MGCDNSTCSDLDLPPSTLTSLALGLSLSHLSPADSKGDEASSLPGGLFPLPPDTPSPSKEE